MVVIIESCEISVMLFKKEKFELHELCAVCRNTQGHVSCGRIKGKTDGLYRQLRTNKA